MAAAVTTIVVFPVLATMVTGIVTVIITAIFFAIIMTLVVPTTIIMVAMIVVSAPVHVSNAVTVDISLLDVMRAEIVVITRFHEIHRAGTRTVTAAVTTPSFEVPGGNVQINWRKNARWPGHN